MSYKPPCSEWAEKLALRPQDLLPAEQAALDAHRRVCLACRTTQAEYRFFDAHLRALPPPPMKPLPRLVRQQDEQDEEERAALSSCTHSHTRQGTHHASGAKARSLHTALSLLLGASRAITALMLFQPEHTTMGSYESAQTTSLTHLFTHMHRTPISPFIIDMAPFAVRF